MKLTAEKIQMNWVEFLSNIETYITGERKDKLLNFYNKYGERIMMMPASHKLVFSAINHDLGKMGDSEHEAYIPQTDKWRKDKLGEDYTFNKKLAFASVPDRGLFLLQEHGISYTFNEMIGIQTHDGLYDSANDKYLKGYMVEQKPRTSLPFILHQADMLAARIEFEVEWLPKFKNNLDKPKSGFTLDTNKKSSVKNKALSSIQSEGLKNIFDKL